MYTQYTVYISINQYNYCNTQKARMAGPSREIKTLDIVNITHFHRFYSTQTCTEYQNAICRGLVQ